MLNMSDQESQYPHSWAASCWDARSLSAALCPEVSIPSQLGSLLLVFSASRMLRAITVSIPSQLGSLLLEAQEGAEGEK